MPIGDRLLLLLLPPSFGKIRDRFRLVLVAIARAMFAVRFQRVLAVEGSMGAALGPLKEQGFILATLLGPSAFFFDGGDGHHYIVAMEEREERKRSAYRRERERERERNRKICGWLDKQV
uniref:Uncharacterized protein n=1 Tax=Musa acuminata TaxID=4641 RepID=Q1ENZ7_MUSAC|nr:hypothetical protein MA4_112I10.46 [Musa acuminata]